VRVQQGYQVSLRPTNCLRFRRVHRFFFAHRPPLLSQRVHPPVSFRSPAESSRSVPAPPLQFSEGAFLGVSFPLRDINRRRPRSRASQLPLSSVLDVSHVLDGLLRHRPCWFVSPSSHVQGSLFRGFSPGVAVPSRRRPIPSCRWLEPAAIRLPVRLRELQAPPSGLALHRDPLRHRRGLAAGTARSPPELLLLQVLRLLAVGGAFASPPLMAFTARPSSRPCG